MCKYDENVKCTRPHATLNYKSPDQKEKEYFQSQNDKIDVSLQ